MKDRLAWVIIFAKFIFWIVSAILTYWMILKLTDHSPTMIDILLGFQIAMITTFVAFAIYVIRFINQANHHMGKVEQHMKESDRRFFTLASDFKGYIKDH